MHDARRCVTVLDSTTGKLASRRDILGGDGDIWSMTYVDEGRSLLAGDSDEKTHIVDVTTLRPDREPFDLPAGNSVGIGDGSTAMVYGIDTSTASLRALAGDRRRHRRRAVRGRPGPASPSRSSPPRTAPRSRRRGRPARSSPPTSRPERSSGGPPVPRCGGSTTQPTASCWSPAPPTAGSACSTLRRWTCSAPCPRPIEAGRSRPARRSSATPTTWRSRRTTVTVYRWETDLDRALEFACQMAGRSLTEEEWEEFLPAQPYQAVCPES